MTLTESIVWILAITVAAGAMTLLAMLVEDARPTLVLYLRMVRRAWRRFVRDLRPRAPHRPVW